MSMHVFTYNGSHIMYIHSGEGLCCNSHKSEVW